MGEDVGAATGDPGVGDSGGLGADDASVTRDCGDYKERRRHSRAAAAEAKVMNDDNYDDHYDGSDACSDFSSVSVDELPPIRAYGHTYHGSGLLLMPNDESERARLEIQHQLFKLCLEGALTATKLPTDRALNVLDIGSGTGNWAVEMGEQYPLANIMGVDISAALLPTTVPPNVVFEVEDANEDWAREKNSLDFVHMRNLVGGGIPDWRALFQQAYEHLKPGGQIEFSEVRTRYFDLVDSSGDEPTAPTEEEKDHGSMTACREFEIGFAQMAAIAGVDFDPIPKIPAILSSVGFERVGRWSDLVPIQAVGHDEKMVRKGAQFAQMLEYGLENYSLAVFVKGGWDEKETRNLLQRVHKESRDTANEAYGKVSFVTARKPMQ
ncbi:methyltransferase [Colletotrichum higginsianum]|uniref:Methyltransferase n=2 Tax=Colletotrichum higginsianum TaxID=80884 RepID=H1VRB8_COLHI|nr:Methyltransferase [Colletotrichum higginsianum IMI 349063]OBR08192.1 Methyltransferase [Colletotrichum higginsianum IMI 349063]TIC89511.1 Secondary metabolism regulator LAE1 [Colletotrichum higginsianum]CCF42774.1 methyltransferase [Colletotrichum higginsianum]